MRFLLLYIEDVQVKPCPLVAGYKSELTSEVTPGPSVLARFSLRQDDGKDVHSQGRRR